jgi:hypothetical protein
MNQILYLNDVNLLFGVSDSSASFVLGIRFLRVGFTETGNRLFNGTYGDAAD